MHVGLRNKDTKSTNDVFVSIFLPSKPLDLFADSSFCTNLRHASRRFIPVCVPICDDTEVSQSAGHEGRCYFQNGRVVPFDGFVARQGVKTNRVHSYTQATA
jgi:hypothetical protein